MDDIGVARRNCVQSPLSKTCMKLDKAQRIEAFTWVLLKLILVLIKPLAWWSDLKKGPGCVEHLYLTLG